MPTTGSRIRIGAGSGDAGLYIHIVMQMGGLLSGAAAIRFWSLHYTICVRARPEIRSGKSHRVAYLVGDRPGRSSDREGAAMARPVWTTVGDESRMTPASPGRMTFEGAVRVLRLAPSRQFLAPGTTALPAASAARRAFSSSERADSR